MFATWHLHWKTTSLSYVGRIGTLAYADIGSSDVLGICVLQRLHQMHMVAERIRKCSFQRFLWFSVSNVLPFLGLSSIIKWEARCTQLCMKYSAKLYSRRPRKVSISLFFFSQSSLYKLHSHWLLGFPDYHFCFNHLSFDLELMVALLNSSRQIAKKTKRSVIFSAAV